MKNFRPYINHIKIFANICESEKKRRDGKGWERIGLVGGGTGGRFSVILQQHP